MKKLALLLCFVATPAFAARYAVVDGSNIIVNMIEAQPGFSLPGMTVTPDNGYNIGGTLVGNVYTPPAAPTPPARAFTFLDFMALFTTDEQTAIVSSNDTQVKIFLLMATGARGIYATDARTPQGFALLVSKGLLTQQRSDAILAAMQ